MFKKLRGMYSAYRERNEIYDIAHQLQNSEYQKESVSYVMHTLQER